MCYLHEVDCNKSSSSPFSDSSFKISNPPINSPLMYNCGYVGQLENFFNPETYKEYTYIYTGCL